jgi:hypothetical protein
MYQDLLVLLNGSAGDDAVLALAAALAAAHAAHLTVLVTVGVPRRLAADAGGAAPADLYAVLHEVERAHQPDRAARPRAAAAGRDQQRSESRRDEPAARIAGRRAARPPRRPLRASPAAMATPACARHGWVR